MKLLSVLTARSIWLGHLSDLNPRGLSLWPHIIHLLVDTYKFTKYPSVQDLSSVQNEIKFEKGEFAVEEAPVSIDLTIYADGLAASSGSSTDHTDAFLKDALERFNEILNLSSYGDVIRKKFYLSEVFVTTDVSLELVNPKLKEISGYLSSNVEENKFFETSGISFCPDQTSKVNPTPFKFERAPDVPFSENRYYSIAPLQTQPHLELLDKMEKILSSK